MRYERIERMERYIATHKSATIDELCEIFQVSKNTVRRDLKDILARGEFKKTYGGICATRSRLPCPFTERVNINIETKRRIAQRAATEIQDGDIIYIDSGTTACHIVDAISSAKDITILTHSLEVMNRGINNPNLTIVSLGGILNWKTLSFTCNNPTEALKHFNIGKAFMAADGITVANGATQSTLAEFNIKKAVLSRCAEMYLLVEHEKFDQISLYTYCELENIDYLITDQAPSQDFMDSFLACGGSVYVV